MLPLKSISTKTIAAILLVSTLSACSFQKSFRTIMMNNDITIIKAIVVIIAWYPPASDLEYFDAQLASHNMSSQNMSFTSSSGDLTITIKDENDGTIIGSNIFAYTLNAQNQVHFAQPSAVTNWVRSFSDYDGFVELNVETNVDVNGPPEGQTGNVSSTFVYNGAALASATASYTNSNGSGCGAGFCEIQ